jgi:hypothetical protein
MGITESLTDGEKISLLETVWGFSSQIASSEAARSHYYFDRYEIIRRKHQSILEHLDHGAVFDIAKLMLAESKQNCAARLTQLCPGKHLTHEHIERALRFIARLIFCVDLDHWPADETLKTHLQELFITSSSEDKCRLPRSFNAWTIRHITDINVTWTLDLNSHLEVTENDGDIALFDGISVLKLLQRSATAQSVFPQGLFDETCNSISLLCPYGDRQVRTWVETEQRTQKLDPGLTEWCRGYHLRPSGRQIQSFSYWRDSLIIVKEIYDEREPRTMKHFWRDHRRPVQWWTFWIAITAFFLSLAACILTAIQVYKAYYPTVS